MPDAPLSFENDIKELLVNAGGACMLTPSDTNGAYPEKAFNVETLIQVRGLATIILVEFVLEKMPPKEVSPEFDYANAAKRFARWIDGGMQA